MAATINTTAPLRSRCSSATIFNLLHHLAGKQQRREPPSPSATAARLRPPHFMAAPSSPQRHQHRDQLSFHHLQPTQICSGINQFREHHGPPPQICTCNALSLRLAPASSRTCSNLKMQQPCRRKMRSSSEHNLHVQHLFVRTPF
ncbi:hypothetical protein DEO72_LG7g1270 [Vigna unguiculata]|uniref:Uncharacterized protein n=1 Tax=Vigna unguiculata TaxID=3917 RepID=A0A4D6MGR6_VIGUN|nr:hypothetical protein DEO72_LG7g1270 [Vigna unguiculata]